LAREPESAGKIESQQLFVQELAGDPSKEVNAQSYTFPIGAVLPWHIHPDADEIAYIIEGTFTFQRAGEQPRMLHDGEADYVGPNVVHRGMDLRSTASALAGAESPARLRRTRGIPPHGNRPPQASRRKRRVNRSVRIALAP